MRNRETAYEKIYFLKLFFRPHAIPEYISGYVWVKSGVYVNTWVLSQIMKVYVIQTGQSVLLPYPLKHTCWIGLWNTATLTGMTACCEREGGTNLVEAAMEELPDFRASERGWGARLSGMC